MLKNKMHYDFAALRKQDFQISFHIKENLISMPYQTHFPLSYFEEDDLARQASFPHQLPLHSHCDFNHAYQ